MTESIRWGILGHATIARICVIPAIARSANGTLRALGSRHPESARETVAAHGIEHLYDHYEDVLQDPGVDAVYIPLPNHLHRPWTLQALAAGKSVLCEKPLACNAAEAAEMAAAAAASRCLLMEAFMYRYHPRSLKIRQMVTDGELGELRLVRAAFCYSMQPELLAAGNTPRLRPEMGGGALLDVGCYGVSLARWLFGAEPEAVQAQAVYHRRQPVDLHLAALLRFPGSGLATVEASFITALQQTYAVVGSSGAIDLPHNAFIPWEADAGFVQRGREDEHGRQHLLAGVDQYRLMVEHFADVVLGRRPPAFGIEDSLANMRVLDAVAAAARSGATVNLDRTELNL
ncbi:MAG TPA: Gfo/Idh/MocA family protein [Desulfobacterales bacterium]